jgi:hypothetical protein
LPSNLNICTDRTRRSEVERDLRTCRNASYVQIIHVVAVGRDAGRRAASFAQMTRVPLGTGEGVTIIINGLSGFSYAAPKTYCSGEESQVPPYSANSLP